MIERINNLMQALLRRKSPINFVDFGRKHPVSHVFGLDRGTPIDRYYIDKFLRKNSHLIKGRVLEVADTRYSKLYGSGEVESFDVLNTTPVNKEVTMVSDLTDTSTLPENKTDCFICTQTFNFIYEVQKAIQGAYYLLKPGGVLLATVAGLCQISRYDMDRWGDYWRFTTASAKKLFESVFKDVDIESFGNVLAAIALLQGVAVEDIPNPELLDEHDPDYQVLIAIVARKGF